MSIFSYIRDIAIAIAALWTAWTAQRGLETWREQLDGTNRYDLARKVLFSAYKMRATIHQIHIPSEDYIPESEALGLSESELKVKQREKAYYSKFDSFYNEMPGFESLTLEAEVLWGREVSDFLEQLREEGFRTLFIAKNDINHPRSLYDSIERVPNKVDQIISSLESKIRPHISEAKSKNFWNYLFPEVIKRVDAKRKGRLHSKEDSIGS